MEKIAWDGPKWGWESLFPANPDLANILGDMDSDFENFIIFGFWGFQNSGFPGPQISRNLAWARLNRGLVANWPEEPSGQKHVDV